MSFPNCSPVFRFVPSLLSPTHYNVWMLLSNYHDGQVITPYLIILRVANRRALTSEAISGVGNADSIRFNSFERTTGDDGIIYDGSPMNSMGTNRDPPVGIGFVVEDPIEEVPRVES